MNYGLLAVASLRSKEALFPLNNPPTLTTLEVACNSADALHAVLLKFTKTVWLKTKFTSQKLKFNPKFH